MRALRRVGASVQSLASVGRGCPDLLVGYYDRLFLFEIKDGAKPPSARKLTPDERAWHDRWCTPVHIVCSVDDALRAIGAIASARVVAG